MTYEDQVGLPVRVYRLRAELGLTRAELARRAVSVSASYIGRLERGDFDNPGARAVVALAKALETTPTFLLTGHDETGVSPRVALGLGFGLALSLAVAGALGAALGTHRHAIDGAGFYMSCGEPAGLFTDDCSLRASEGRQ